MSAFQNITTKVKSVARALKTKIVSIFTAVKNSKAVQAVATRTVALRSKIVSSKILTLLKPVLSDFGLSIFIVVISRAIFSNHSVKRWWTDWRNNHRRIVSILSEAFFLSVGSWIFALVWTSLLIPAAVALLISLVASVVTDLALRAEHGDLRSVSSAYTPLRFVIRWVLRIGWYLPLAVIQYQPIWVMRFAAPAYIYEVRTITSVSIQGEEPVKDETPTPKDVFDEAPKPEQPKAPKDEQPKPEKPEAPKPEQPVEEEAVVVIDTDSFQKSPVDAGRDLRAKIVSDYGVGIADRYRKRLAAELRKAGLSSKQVTLGLRGFDKHLAAV